MAAKPNAFTFQGKLSARDWAHIQWYQFAAQFPKRVRWVTALLLKGVAAACLYAMIEYGATIGLAWGFLLSSGAAVYMIFLSVLIKTRAADHYRKHKDDFLETVVSLTEAGASVENERIKFELPWQQIILVLDTPKGLMFCGRRYALWFWLPTKVFSEDTTCNDVRNLLEAVGVAMRQVS